MWIGICHILKISWHRLQLASVLIDMRSIWLSIWPSCPFLIQLLSQSCSPFFPSSSKGFTFFSAFIQCLIVKPSPLPRALSWICSSQWSTCCPVYLWSLSPTYCPVGFNSIHYQFLEPCIFLSLDSHIPADPFVLLLQCFWGHTNLLLGIYTHSLLYQILKRNGYILGNVLTLPVDSSVQ